MPIAPKFRRAFGAVLLGMAVPYAGPALGAAIPQSASGAFAEQPDTLAATTGGAAGEQALRTQPGLGTLAVDPRRELTLHPIALPLQGTPARSVQLPPLSLLHPYRPTPLTASLQLSRFETAWVGAGRGAYAGMALGFVGTQSAMWTQRTSWALMGIGAALGALWGSTLGNDNPSVQMRVEPQEWDRQQLDRWDRDQMERWDRRE